MKSVAYIIRNISSKWTLHRPLMYKREVLAMTAVIYARYSTDSQREESIEGQIRECTAYAEKNGFTVVKHYIDRAILRQDR